MTSRDGIAEWREVIELLADAPSPDSGPAGAFVDAGRAEETAGSSDRSSRRSSGNKQRRGVHHGVAPTHPAHT